MVATAPVPHALTVALCNSLSISIVSRLPPKEGPVAAVRRFSGHQRDVCHSIHGRVSRKHRICVICPLVGRDRGVSLGGLRRKCRRVLRRFPRYAIYGIRNGVGPTRGSRRVRLFISNGTRVVITAAIVRIKIGIPGTSIVVVRGTRHFKLSRLRRLHNQMKHKTRRSCYVLIAGCGLARSAQGQLRVVIHAGSNFRVTRTSLGLHNPNSLRNARRDNVTFSLGVTSVIHSNRLLRCIHTVTRDVMRRSPTTRDPRGRVL